MNGVYTPPNRNASPFQPPPLYPISLNGFRSFISAPTQILSRALAEEIRLLIPPRLQLVENWTLAYSLEQDGVSLATLYKKCAEYQGTRGGFVIVIRDGDGGIFGAYLTDPPKPSPHYYGTGECFLWRASILSADPLLSSLPPPPSSDTSNMMRSTTVSGPKPSHVSAASDTSGSLAPAKSATSASPSGTSTPERIRFKAFPYSGVNDYMIFCEQGFLSVGGGDGHYGLWLDDNFEKGISSSCPTFGNEPLSDEGDKFDILGVEVWYIGT
ncbi:MAG: oxidation resistance protein 1 [Sclerophora amabilis]|nr:MAG: oxidation resistance protein 1 [Sclerophora amabilis]